MLAIRIMTLLLSSSRRVTVSGCILPVGWHDRILCFLRAASRNPPHGEWPQGSGAFCFHLRDERQAQLQSQEALGRGRRMDFFLFLLLF